MEQKSGELRVLSEVLRSASKDVDSLGKMAQEIHALTKGDNAWRWIRLGDDTEIAPITVPDVFKNHWFNNLKDTVSPDLQRTMLKYFWKDIGAEDDCTRLIVGATYNDTFFDGKEALYGVWELNTPTGEYYLVFGLSPFGQMSQKIWLVRGKVKGFLNLKNIGSKKAGLCPCERIKNIEMSGINIFKFGPLCQRLLSEKK